MIATASPPSAPLLAAAGPDEEASYAGKLLTTFQLGPTILTIPSYPPRNKLSEPEQTAETSLVSKRERREGSEEGPRACASLDSGILIWVASKKSKDRHCLGEEG